MKLTGITGTGTGKLGSSVFSTSAGEQIVRQYQPNVANPNTVKQVNQRSRLKLMSQIAAALSNVIVIPKQGLVSARNQFIKKNMSSVYANNGEALVSYENLQLTAGNLGLPAVVATRTEQGALTVKLAESAAGSVSRVVYCLFRKTSENELQLITSNVVTDAGANGTFDLLAGNISGELIIYAYGMRDKDASASAKYQNYSVRNGEDIATLVANRSISSADYTFTQTRGNTLFGDDTETIDPAAGQAMVYITSGGGGTVSGTGFENGRKAVTIGESVTVVATPAEGYTFDGWYINGVPGKVSATASYTFNVTGKTDLIAGFLANGAIPW